MVVWIVSRGERYEGSYIVNVYFSKENALKKVKSMISDRSSYQPEWVTHKSLPDYWESGCDIMKIQDYEVL